MKVPYIATVQLSEEIEQPMPRLDIKCCNYFKLMRMAIMGLSGSNGGEIIGSFKAALIGSILRSICKLIIA